ncbi:Sex determination protein tasselseed-2 [Glycine soja]|nr:Sex determination protein tasselseed-2 [Glycine soja]
MAHYGKLDIMYNNAGIPSPSVPPGIVDLDLNELDFVMKINKRGMIVDIKHAARVMILVGLGSILCTSSITPIPTPMVLAQIGKFYSGLTQEQIVGIVNGFGELEGAKCEDIDVAKAPLYLASDEAKFISGLNLIVDGGFTSFKSLTCHLQIKLFNPSY